MGLGKLVIVDDRVIEPWRIAAGLDAALLAQGPRAASRSPRRWHRRWHRLVPPVLQAVTTGDSHLRQVNVGIEETRRDQRVFIARRRRFGWFAGADLGDSSLSKTNPSRRRDLVRVDQ